MFSSHLIFFQVLQSLKRGCFYLSVFSFPPCASVVIMSHPHIESDHHRFTGDAVRREISSESMLCPKCGLSFFPGQMSAHRQEELRRELSGTAHSERKGSSGSLDYHASGSDGPLPPRPADSHPHSKFAQCRYCQRHFNRVLLDQHEASCFERSAPPREDKSHCTQCGYRVEPSANFCAHCGVFLHTTTDE